MNFSVNILRSEDTPSWDHYVTLHPDSTLYHLSGWKNIIENTYGHSTYYLIAKREFRMDANYQNGTNLFDSKNPPERTNTNIVGVLPLVHLKHFLFGNSLVSIPFFDLGGVLADDDDVAKVLILEALNIAKRLMVDTIELRHLNPLSWLNSNDLQVLTCNLKSGNHNWAAHTHSHKVRMILDLPDSSEVLIASFKAKLRSQIKKPAKDGLCSKSGALELLDDFYNVFSINMRDLGSPVHSKRLINNVLKEFSGRAKIIIIYKDKKKPIACAMMISFKETLENPWASALREYSPMSPNMLLYWKMLEYACDNGFKKFDFGRSSPYEGTYRFKAQWGAYPMPLNWQYLSVNRKPGESNLSEKTKYSKAIKYWQKMPVHLTKILGPIIRKNISL
jgi:serine/alanine adding enzyme